MTFGMQEIDIRQYLENISASAMSRIFKPLRLHEIIERVKGLSQPDLQSETLCLYQHWHRYFSI